MLSMESTTKRFVSQHSIESILSILIIFLAVYVLKRNSEWKRLYRFPPGPKGLPLLGIFHEIYDYPAHLAYTTYARDFGPIITANVMGRKTVILNDVETVREAMLKCSPIVDDRSAWRYCFIKLLKGLSVMPYSKKWINTRRRTVMILRDYGMGKSFLEPQICDEARALMANIVRDCDDGKRNMMMRDRIRRVPVNVICNMLFSERYDYDDSSLLFILNTMEYLLTFLRTACTHDSLPEILRPVMKNSLKDFHSNIQVLYEFLHSKVKYHEETYQDGVTRDFVDAWIKARKTNHMKVAQQADMRNNNCTDDISASDALEFDETSYSAITDVLQDVLFAGAHSTGYALNWLIMLLTIRKDIQDQVYHSIIDTIGPTRMPTMNDKAKLPIVEAVIFETIRVSSLVPLVGHACLDDVTLHGYDLPKDTEVTYNNWAINHDEENFPNSFSFLPERWLTANGNFDRVLATKFFPFGIDESVGQECVPEIKHVQSFVLEPKPYKLRVKKRPTAQL